MQPRHDAFSPENLDTFVPLRLVAFLRRHSSSASHFPLHFKPIGALGLSHGSFLAARYSRWLASTPFAFGADLQQRLQREEGADFSSYLFYRNAAASLITSIYITLGNKPQFASRGFAICIAYNVPSSNKSSDSAKTTTTKPQWGINGRKVVNPWCFNAKKRAERNENEEGK